MTDFLKRKVVITGMGLVTSIGHDLPSSWAALKSGSSGIIKVPQPSYFQLSDKLEHLNIACVKNFPFKDWIAPHADNRMNSFLLKSAGQAIADSGLSIEPDRTGISLGIMSGNTTQMTKFISQGTAKGFDKINRLSMLHILANIPTAALSIRYGIKGPTNTFATACASSASAILDGYNRIRAGQVEAMLVGGSQDVYNPTVLYSSLRLQAMTSKKYEDPAQSSRPFDEQRSGFVLGQGAGVMILQEETSALQRGARIYGQVISGATTSDGFHLTRPAEKGEGIYKAMQKAIKNSGLDLDEIDMVNCHATSTPKGDQLQLSAISRLFKGVQAVALKGHIGHAFGAAGIIQSVFGVMMAKQNFKIPTKNLKNPIKEFTNVVLKGFSEKPIKLWMKNSMGFGGVNVSLLFRNR